MKFQAFFFDFDGVLADSVEVKTRAFAKMFEQYGEKIQGKVIDFHRRHGGMNRFDKFRHYYSDFLGITVTEEELQDLCSKFAKLVVDEVVQSPEIPGAEKFLQKCSSIAPCFVISATPESEIRTIIKRRNLTGYLKGVFGAPTDKAENLRKLLSQYKYNPGRCLFWGDAESDFQAAQTNNVPFIGILPDHKAPLLQTHPEIKWFNNFKQIKDNDLYGG